MARQPRLDVPVSSHQARLGREAVCVCKHSLLLGQFLPDSPGQLGPSVAFVFLPKITIGFSGYSGRESDSPESMWQLEDRKGALSISVSPRH